MITRAPKFAVKITHVQSGETACVDSQIVRSEREATRLASMIIWSRMAALQSDIKRLSTEVATYNLPDDLPWPNALFDYRQLV